jgi:hypothetical protein
VAAWQDVPEEWQRSTRLEGLVRLRRPCLSLLGSCPARWLWQQVLGRPGMEPLWERWLFFAAAGKGGTLPLPPPPEPEATRRLREGLECLSQVQGEMVLSPEARAEYGRWLEEFESADGQEEGPQPRGWSPAGSAALQIAMIYEATICGKMEISGEAMRLAQALVQELWDQLGNVLHSEGPGGKQSAEFRRVCRAIQAAGPAGVRRNVLLKKLSPMLSSRLEQVLRTLEEAEQITRSKEGKAAWLRWL